MKNNPENETTKPAASEANTDSPVQDINKAFRYIFDYRLKEKSKPNATKAEIDSAHIEQIKKRIDEFLKIHDINASNQYGCTLLHKASMEAGLSFPEVIDYLLSQGADCNIQNTFGLSAAMALVLRGYQEIEILKKFINSTNGHPLDFRIKSKEGLTILEYSADASSFETFDYLFKNRKETTEKEYSSLLDLAIGSINNPTEKAIAILEDPEVKELIKERKFDINQINDRGMSYVSYAFAQRNDDLTLYLLNNGGTASNPNIIIQKIASGPLSPTKLKLFRELLRQNPFDFHKILDTCVRNGKTECVRALLEAASEKEESLAQNSTETFINYALSKALQKNAPKEATDIFFMLSEYDSKCSTRTIDTRNNNGLAPIHLLAAHPDPTLLQKLLKHNPNINLVIQNTEETALEIALKAPKLQNAQELLMLSEKFDSSYGLKLINIAMKTGCNASTYMSKEDRDSLKRQYEEIALNIISRTNFSDKDHNSAWLLAGELGYQKCLGQLLGIKDLRTKTREEGAAQTALPQNDQTFEEGWRDRSSNGSYSSHSFARGVTDNRHKPAGLNM